LGGGKKIAIRHSRYCPCPSLQSEKLKKKMKQAFSVFLAAFLVMEVASGLFVINTWSGDFEGATYNAFQKLQSNGTAVDAVEAGCQYCEEHQCDTTVGYGNHPDTRGETSLDAMIMDGNTFDMGCVGFLRRHRKAISIARAVMHYTDHTMLVGDGAEEFASMMGFPLEETTTENSRSIYNEWQANNCQPNFYANIPEAKTSCGPYHPNGGHLNNISSQNSTPSAPHKLWAADKTNHDTIGIVTIDSSGSMACGTSTNGASHKVAGRIGDSPIPGAGCYVNTAIGGAAATGDGDVMMRFLPSYTAVTYMELGFSPKDACQKALDAIVKIFPSFSGGVVCLTKNGDHAAATHNMDFAYSYMTDGMTTVGVIPVSE
jgi:N4-(beta-N-acetylglucosaminyl)-L-asparaginase